MQWCCLSRRTTLCTGPPRTLWMLGSAWEVDPRRLAVITHLTTSRCERERKWEEDNRVDMSSERSRTPGKNECVGVCVCLYLCTRAEGELESILDAPHMTVIEKALLIACWCEGRDFKKKRKKENQQRWNSASFGPQGSPSTTETPQEALQ